MTRIRIARGGLFAAAARCAALGVALTAATMAAAGAAGADGYVAQTAQAAGAGGCAEVRQVELESREPITAAVGYGEARERAIRQALVLAVGVAGGPGEPGATGAALDYRSARDRVLAHEVVSERVARQGARDSVVVAVRASICVPASAPMPVREVIAVGDFVDNTGRPLPGARRQLIDFFETLGNSERFEFIQAHPASAPADIVIAGRVTGGGVSSSGERLEVQILIEARFLRSGQVITSTDVGKKGIKRGADVLEYLPEAIRRAVERAGPRVYVGIEESPPPQVAAGPPMAPPPYPRPAPAPPPGPGSVMLYVPNCMESFRQGALAAAGMVDEALLDHVVESTARCTQDAWRRTATRRGEWVSRDYRRDRRYAELCDGLDRELERMYARSLEGSPRDRLRDRILGLCRDELPRRLAVAAP